MTPPSQVWTGVFRQPCFLSWESSRNLSVRYLWHVTPLFPSRYEQVKQQYDLKCQEAELLKTRLEQSSHHQQLEEINALQKSIGEDRLNFLCFSTDRWGPWDYHRIDKDSEPFLNFCLVFSPNFPPTSPLCHSVLYAFFSFFVLHVYSEFS